MARILRGDILWADLDPVRGRVSPEELHLVVEGLNEIVAD
jgi:hypothetical protein